MPLSAENEQLRDEIITRINKTKLLAIQATNNYEQGIDTVNNITQEINRDIENLKIILQKIRNLGQQSAQLENVQQEIKAVLEQIAATAPPEEIQQLEQQLEGITSELDQVRRSYDQARQELTNIINTINLRLDEQIQKPKQEGGYTYPERRTIRRQRKPKKTQHKKKTHNKNKKRKTHKSRK